MDNKPSSPIPVGSLVRLFNKLTDERLGNADGVVLNFHKDKSHPADTMDYTRFSGRMARGNKFLLKPFLEMQASTFGSWYKSLCW